MMLTRRRPGFQLHISHTNHPLSCKSVMLGEVKLIIAIFGNVYFDSQKYLLGLYLTD